MSTPFTVQHTADFERPGAWLVTLRLRRGDGSLVSSEDLTSEMADQLRAASKAAVLRGQALGATSFRIVLEESPGDLLELDPQDFVGPLTGEQPA